MLLCDRFWGCRKMRRMLAWDRETRETASLYQVHLPIQQTPSYLSSNIKILPYKLIFSSQEIFFFFTQNIFFTYLSAANQDKQNHQWHGKGTTKSEKITAFSGIFFVLDKFDSILSSVIDSHLGLRSTLIGYQYSDIFSFFSLRITG